MKGLIPAFLALFLFVPAAGHAQTKNITQASSDHVAKLESLHQDAVDHLLRNDFDKALRAYEDILLLEPDDDTAYTGQGQIYMVLGQFKRAHDAFRSALEIDPNNEVALAGIQKIMDPDGVEGMISTNAAMGFIPEEGAVPPAPAVEPIPMTPAPRALPVELDWRTWMRPKTAGPMRGLRSPKTAIVETKIEKLHVQRVQMALKNAGYYDGPIDGILGDSTMKAVRKFQTKHGLETTGTVNVATWNTLSGYLDAGR